MNNGDLTHINKQMQRDDVIATDARRQADTYRMNAEQNRARGQSPDYYEQEAARLDDQASDAEDEKNKLQAEKEQIEKQINELQTQRTQAEQEYSSKLSQIDSELARLRGSGLL